MALTTTYIVVPFLAGSEDILHPAAPRRSTSRSSAIAVADRLARIYAGVIVLRDRNDPEAGIFLEPVLICAMGDVPLELMQGDLSSAERPSDLPLDAPLPRSALPGSADQVDASQDPVFLDDGPHAEVDLQRD